MEATMGGLADSLRADQVDHEAIFQVRSVEALARERSAAHDRAAQIVPILRP